ncbi:TIGR03086 family metal-binding protein [Streptomyces sp. NPDC057702]|uniref:TIGR03086 family metal-binding protein n=1 Tax=unclassified Streptomyces TaxID=2593676 RepID=UPI0036941247
MAETSEEHRVAQRHREAIELFTARVHAIGPDQWDAPTPCADWSVRDLVNHLTAEQLWVPPLVREGSTLADQGTRFDGDQLGTDPVAAWDDAAAGALAAFAEPGALARTVHLSSGPGSALGYCSQMTMDAVVHAWDLSRAIGADERLPAELVDFAAQEVAPYAADLVGTGLFAPPLTPPPGADAQQRLLSLLGRES